MNDKNADKSTKERKMHARKYDSKLFDIRSNAILICFTSVINFDA